MPRKRTRGKRRDLAAQRDTWDVVFGSGYDFFDELPDHGVPTDAYGRPDEAVAADAWAQLGAEYLLTHQRADARGEPIWALRQFGEPQNARQAN